MRSHSGYLAGCGGAVFAVACFLIGLEVSATTAAPSVGPTAPMVERALKSDRLPLVPVKSRNAIKGPIETNAPAATPPPSRACSTAASPWSAQSASRRSHRWPALRVLIGTFSPRLS